VGTTPHFSTAFLQRAQCSHCKRCISYGNSVRLSVRPSVRPSVRLSHAGIVSKRLGMYRIVNFTIRPEPEPDSTKVASQAQ